MDWKARLKEARLKAGYKRKNGFAKVVGVSPPTVTDWEKPVEDGGIEKLKGENLVRICAVLGITADWLLDGVEEDPALRIQQENLEILVMHAGGPNKLASALDLKDSVVYEWMNGPPGGSPVPIPALTRRFIESARSLPQGWMDEPHETWGEIAKLQRREYSNMTPALEVSGALSIGVQHYKRIPAFGRAMGGLPERIWDQDGNYPAGFSDVYAEVATQDHNAFLTPIEGMSMVPRFNPGEYALVEPNTAPELEDDVLVRLKDGRTMLKRLLSRRGGFRFGSYSDPEIISVAEEEVTWMYYVAHPVPARKIKNRL